MRLRTALSTVGATLLLFAGMTSAASAQAGTGASTPCSTYVIDNTTVTLVIDEAPGYLGVCYSTAPPGTPGQVTGGRIDVAYSWTVLSPASAMVFTRCTADYQFGAAPVCNDYLIVLSEPNDVLVTPYTAAACGVWLNGTCQAFLPGATVWTDTSSLPILYVDTFGNNVSVNPPGQCIGIIAGPTCP